MLFCFAFLKYKITISIKFNLNYDKSFLYLCFFLSNIDVINMQNKFINNQSNFIPNIETDF